MSLDLSSTIANLNAAKAEYDRIVDSAIEPLKKQLVEFVRENEDVVAFGWTQYTPYFNDGDACVFGVNSPSVLTKSLVDQEGYDSPQDALNDLELWDWVELWGKAPYDSQKELITPKLFAKAKELANFIEGQSDIMERAFGDHVRIIVTNDGVDVEEYSHD